MEGYTSQVKRQAVLIQQVSHSEYVGGASSRIRVRSGSCMTAFPLNAGAGGAGTRSTSRIVEAGTGSPMPCITACTFSDTRGSHGGPRRPALPDAPAVVVRGCCRISSSPSVVLTLLGSCCVRSEMERCGGEYGERDGPGAARSPLADADDVRVMYGVGRRSARAFRGCALRLLREMYLLPSLCCAQPRAGADASTE
jgi:hypothetical protein